MNRRKKNDRKRITQERKERTASRLLEVQIVQSNHLFVSFLSSLVDLPFSITMDVMMILMTLLIVILMIELWRWHIENKLRLFKIKFERDEMTSIFFSSYRICFAWNDVARWNQPLNEGQTHTWLMIEHARLHFLFLIDHNEEIDFLFLKFVKSLVFFWFS